MAKEQKQPIGQIVSKEDTKAEELRDWFAGCALIGGMETFYSTDNDAVWNDYDDFAKSCYHMADAMLKARST